MPYEAFACADGWAIIAVGNDNQFQRLSDMLDLPENSEWATNAGRVADRVAVSAAVSSRTGDWERDALLAALADEGIPAGPINTVEQALTDPQVVARGMVLDLGEGIGGLRTPIRFSEAALVTGEPSPILGS